MSGHVDTVLVTGGAGYIGSHLVGRLLASGSRVRVLDNLTFGGHGLLPYLSHERFDFLHGDIRTKADVGEALDGVDKVVHLAAIVGDPACAQNPELAHEVNGLGSASLGELAVASGVKRFVFASTCSNYGRMGNTDTLVDETSPLKPVSLYAEHKVAFEKHLLAQGSDGFHPVILRFATAYGLSSRPRFDLTVNEFTRELTLKRKLEIYGQKFWRPYTHASDLAAACLMALEADTDIVSGQAFNVGDTRENFQKETLVQMIVRELGPGHDNVVYVHKDEDPRDYRVDFTKIQQALRFNLTRRVIDGIREIANAIKTGIVVDPDNEVYRNV
ncbi:MAG: NAD-dependent epimerase/dehydratase family protein [candidate division Zixibacteria bacterium]|nr:NAD-dependent epimerase/dehydratase family protein [candidate division Zixibacteria bacterium]MDH3937534.1 NAD-dependent epimerase/dehydratase family protein [candidate division Zixibacteria bacterium]MDH4034385.1 NAD-dependent epimerase/dehydratase family protein [candidate division Zixibacteria bacterium]